MAESKRIFLYPPSFSKQFLCQKWGCQIVSRLAQQFVLKVFHVRVTTLLSLSPTCGQATCS
jgi:hypothetical protein